RIDGRARREGPSSLERGPVGARLRLARACRGARGNRRGRIGRRAQPVERADGPRRRGAGVAVILDRAEIEQFRGAVARRLGLAFDETKCDLLAAAIQERLDAYGHERPAVYLSKLLSLSDWREEWRILAEKLTVAETYFFRNRDHFRAFEEVALCGCSTAAAEGGEYRILSAGCAPGAE